MKKLMGFMIMGLMGALLLAACGSTEADESSASALAGDAESTAASEVSTALQELSQDLGSDEGANRGAAQLSDSYADALSIPGQLAVGTTQLEETDLAVDEEEAAELLPLWEALVALRQSDTTAEVELESVVKQIQKTMTAEQIQAIAAMALTSESLQELQNSGALAMGGPGINRDDSSGSFQMPSGAGPGGGGPPDDMGGPPDGGIGGPPGGGDFGGGMNMGAASADSAQVDQESMQDMMLTNMVVRLLQTKTGQEPAFGPGAGPGNAQMAAVTAVGEATGLDMPTIQAELQTGKSLAEITSENGGDVAAVKAALQETLADTQLPEGQDLGTFVDDLLD